MDRETAKFETEVHLNEAHDKGATITTSCCMSQSRSIFKHLALRYTSRLIV